MIWSYYCHRKKGFKKISFLLIKWTPLENLGFLSLLIFWDIPCFRPHWHVRICHSSLAVLDPEPPQGNCSACLGRNSKRAKCLEQFGKFASFVTSFGAAFEGTELTYKAHPLLVPLIYCSLSGRENHRSQMVGTLALGWFKWVAMVSKSCCLKMKANSERVEPPWSKPTIGDR